LSAWGDAGNNNGIVGGGNGSGAGMSLGGGTSGAGLVAVGYGVNSGIYAQSNGDGSAAGSHAIRADAAGTGGHGFWAQGGSANGGSGIKANSRVDGEEGVVFSAGAGNTPGFAAYGSGTGAGILGRSLSNTPTGPGIKALGGAGAHDILATELADVYQAKVWLQDDDAGTSDRYMVVWYLNGQPIFGGITLPTIQVIKIADGTDLVASTAMTQIGATGMYRYTEALNRIVSGAGYMVVVTATIASVVRTWVQPMGRDST
jgi:hypothetical protein